jgi:hypothetical protein
MGHAAIASASKACLLMGAAEVASFLTTSQTWLSVREMKRCAIIPECH